METVNRDSGLHNRIESLNANSNGSSVAMDSSSSKKDDNMFEYKSFKPDGENKLNKMDEIQNAS